MARTFPTDGLSPCDFYASAAPAVALGHFQWDLTGSSVPAADAMIMLDLNDATTATSGTIRGLFVDADISGSHASGSKWVRCIDLDMSITDNYYRYVSGINIGWDITSGKNAKNNYGVYMYFDAPGSGTVDAIIPLGIDRNTTANVVCEDWDCMARFVVHGEYKITTLFSFEGYPYISDFLFHFEHDVIPVSGQATALSGVTTSHKIAIKLGSNTAYIPVITSFA